MTRSWSQTRRPASAACLRAELRARLTWTGLQGFWQWRGQNLRASRKAATAAAERRPTFMHRFVSICISQHLHGKPSTFSWPKLDVGGQERYHDAYLFSEADGFKGVESWAPCLFFIWRTLQTRLPPLQEFWRWRGQHSHASRNAATAAAERWQWNASNMEEAWNLFSAHISFEVVGPFQSEGSTVHSYFLAEEYRIAFLLRAGSWAFYPDLQF